MPRTTPTGDGTEPARISSRIASSMPASMSSSGSPSKNDHSGSGHVGRPRPGTAATPPSPSATGSLAANTTRRTRSGRASAAAQAIAPPIEWPTRATSASSGRPSTTETTAATWSATSMPLRSVSTESRPGRVTGCARCPAASRCGTTRPHDDAFSQSPGTRTMSIPGTLDEAADSSPLRRVGTVVSCVIGCAAAPCTRDRTCPRAAPVRA